MTTLKEALAADYADLLAADTATTAALRRFRDVAQVAGRLGRVAGILAVVTAAAMVAGIPLRTGGLLAAAGFALTAYAVAGVALLAVRAMEKTRTKTAADILGLIVHPGGDIELKDPGFIHPLLTRARALREE